MALKKTLVLVTLIGLLSVTFVYGSMYQRQHPGYLSYLKMRALHAIGIEQDTDQDFVLSHKQIAALLRIDSVANGVALRDRLWRFLTGEAQADFSLPPVIRIDDNNFVVQQRFGLDSNIYLSSPGASATLVILHCGHKPSNAVEAHLEEAILDAGLSVARFDMPLVGANHPVSVDLPRFGNVKIRSHNHMELLEYVDVPGHPLQYFVVPVFSFVDYALNEAGYEQVVMIGFSGGGWATVLSAALEPRIQHSVHVASSYPFFLRTLSSTDWGDYEQHNMDLYHVANYLDLYSLGALEADRSQLQVVNEYDFCCYGGHGGEYYLPVIQQNLQQIGGGSWNLIQDRSIREHDVSPQSQQQIVELLLEINRGQHAL